jgi:quinone-modifying oxidoreductase subunit QmoC
MLVGVVIVLLERFKDREKRSPTTYFDWFFLLTLAAVLATGIASELLRLQQDKIPMFVIYFIHLTLIFALFLYAPYSKFAHLLYRTLAMAATWEGGKGATNSDSSYPRSLPPAESSDTSTGPEAPSNLTSS